MITEHQIELIRESFLKGYGNPLRRRSIPLNVPNKNTTPEPKMITIETLEQLRNLGEGKHIASHLPGDNLFTFIMRIGECRHILHMVLSEFQDARRIMKELENAIPQFHKQPGLFKELQERIDQLTNAIRMVKNRLSYIEEKKESAEKEDNENYVPDDLEDLDD